MKYYNIRKLIKKYPECKYYVIYGERSNGKTYSSIDLAIENFFKNGKQFAYVRRFNEDIRPKYLTELFSSHIKNGVLNKYTDDYNTVVYKSNKFYPAYIDEEDQAVSSRPLGFAFDLNSMEHNKSLSYPDINIIIFDEFMSRNGYLPNEFVLFMNVLSTIIRDRKDVIIIMLGNTVNKYCPYFNEMGLKHVRDQEKGTVDVYRYGKSGLNVAVERTADSGNAGKGSDIYFAFDNPQLQMIKSGEWEIEAYPHLEKRYEIKNVIIVFFIIMDGDIVQGNIICDENGIYIFMHEKNTPIKKEDDIVYTLESSPKWNIRANLLCHNDKISMAIKKLIHENRCFYSTNQCGEIVRNYLKCCAMNKS